MSGWVVGVVWLRWLFVVCGLVVVFDMCCYYVGVVGVVCFGLVVMGFVCVVGHCGGRCCRGVVGLVLSVCFYMYVGLVVVGVSWVV